MSNTAKVVVDALDALLAENVGCGFSELKQRPASGLCRSV